MSETSPDTPKVFISYRRSESGGHAGRLYDAMAARFGERNVFMDVALQPGVDFVERITAAVSACHVLLVVMGPDWARAAPGAARPRIGDPDDFVRLEVATALRRNDVTVIPVLVEEAEMPEPDELPEDLRALTRRNALELSDLRWRSDVARLLGVMETLLADTQTPAAAAPPTKLSRLRERSALAAAAAAVAVVVALVIVLTSQPKPADDARGGTPTAVVPDTASSDRPAKVPGGCHDGGDAELADMSATRHWVCDLQGTERAVDPSLSYFEYREAAPAQHELATTLSWLAGHGWNECDNPALERTGQTESFCVVATADAADEAKRGTVAIFWHPTGSRLLGRATFERPTTVPAAVEFWSRHL